MQSLDQRIIRFIEKNQVMTLATTVEQQPHCASLFYAYCQEDNRFVVTSSLSTRHGKEAMANPNIAASIVGKSRSINRLQGIQMQGRIEIPSAAEQKEVRAIYLKRFPFAAAANLELWVIHPTFVKFTNNRLGFGKKLIWRLEEEFSEADE